MKRGLLFVVSGPSGCGKGTVVSLLQKEHDFAVSVSATTRAPREGEVDGVHYHFWTHERFEKAIADGEMLEYTLYSGSGRYYGTPKAHIAEELESGRDVILEIEVDGAMQIKKRMPEAILVFMVPPSMKALRARLIGRGTESLDVIEARTERAYEELRLAHDYDYIIVNGENSVEETAQKLLDIASAERFRTARNTDFINTLISEQGKE